eukprot:gene10731-17805_t
MSPGDSLPTPQTAIVKDYYGKELEAYSKDVLKYEKPNMKFIKGEIEYLDKAGIPDKSVDLVISNCVVSFQDVYRDRRLPKELQTHPVLWGEGLGGALYINDFIRICRKVGFTDPRSLVITPIAVLDPDLAELCGEAKFYSITYRLFKVPGRIEDLCEMATYKGTIQGHKNVYDLDDHHRFVKGKPMLVCGNTASMVEETWLVTGNRDVHFGQFDCSGGAVPIGVSAAASGGAGAGDCASGACC